MIIVLFVAIWLEKYEEYLHTDNLGMGISNPPKWEHKFMQQMIEDNKTGRFHFDVLLAATAFFFWIRLLMMLTLTFTFGPLITITIKMMKDLSIFFVLFTIELIAFSCVGILSFGNLDQYESLHGTMVMFFESALGNFEFTMYDDAGSVSKKWFGIIFHITVVTVNMILLLNLVIAIMTDTYRTYAEVKLGLFAQGIIPSYKNHK